MRRSSVPRSPLQHDQGVRRPSVSYDEQWRLCVLDGFVAQSAGPRPQAGGIDLHLRRLAIIWRDSIDGGTLFPNPFADYVGTGKGAGSKSELEERGRGHLVLHYERQLHVQPRRRSVAKESRRSVRGSGGCAQGLDNRFRGPLPRHMSFECLDRPHCAVLVDARTPSIPRRSPRSCWPRSSWRAAILATWFWTRSSDRGRQPRSLESSGDTLSRSSRTFDSLASRQSALKWPPPAIPSRDSPMASSGNETRGRRRRRPRRTFANPGLSIDRIA